MRTIVVIITALLITSSASPQADIASVNGKRQKRIVIRNATIVDGSGKPAAGPYDIAIEGDVIKQIQGIDPVAAAEGRARRPEKGDVEIDAKGKYVLPGLINLHGHTHDERGGKPMPVEYCLKLWLASGITTVRDVGAGRKTLSWREDSAAGRIAAPRIFAYGVFQGGPATTPELARARVREL
ncbi:MAG TPA: hypothetical protein VNA17_07730, partial [Pyrinomonadaceae bacterium]|nr:hypothetical protein [Pyrinomonadaceae bacterium]